MRNNNFYLLKPFNPLTLEKFRLPFSPTIARFCIPLTRSLSRETTLPFLNSFLENFTAFESLRNDFDLTLLNLPFFPTSTVNTMINPRNHYLNNFRYAFDEEKEQ